MPDQITAAIPSFQLRAVELHELNLVKLPASIPSISNFNFEINVEANVDPEKKIIIVCTKVKINADDKTTNLGSITCACVFSVGNFGEIVKLKADGNFEIENDFSETLNSISISTTRGVMYGSLKGTALHYAFLPLIDIKTLTKADPVLQ